MNLPLTNQNSQPSSGPSGSAPRDPPRFLRSVPLGVKNHIVAALAEFVGTFLFLFFALGGAQVANTAANPDQQPDAASLLYISLAFGMSLAVNVWVFYRISGGLFNPAVTVGFIAAGGLGVVRGLIIIVAQVLGGIVAAALLHGLTGPLVVQTILSPGVGPVQGLFLELFLTTQLVLTIFMLAVEKHRSTFIAPVGIGLSLFIAELV